MYFPRHLPPLRQILAMAFLKCDSCILLIGNGSPSRVIHTG